MHTLCMCLAYDCANSKSGMTIMYGPLVIMRRPSYKIKTFYSYPMLELAYLQYALNMDVILCIINL